MKRFEELRIELPDFHVKNFTLGVHAQEEDVYNELDEKIGEAHVTYIGVLLFRFAIEFRNYNFT